MKNKIKMQKAKFKPGDIVINKRNEFQRLIRKVEYIERSGTLKVMYSYSVQELDDKLHPTANFMTEINGYCSQDHLLTWERGESKGDPIKRYKMYPPPGYEFVNGGFVDINDEQSLRQCALYLSDDPKFKEKISQASRNELVDFFKENGFIFES